MILISPVLGLGVIFLFAASYVAAAWHLARRGGRRWLLGAWIVGALLFWLISMARLELGGAGVNIPPHTDADRLAVFGFLACGLLGVGLATLSVLRRLGVSADGRLTFGTTMAGVAAFLGGIFLTLFAIFLGDVWVAL